MLFPCRQRTRTVRRSRLRAPLDAGARFRKRGEASNEFERGAAETGERRVESDQNAKRHTLCYTVLLKYFTWDREKNEKLRAQRGVSFDEIVLHIERGDVLDILEHPKPERYEGQRIFVVQLEDYVYLVPFVEEKEQVVLKTIIPSRKATKKYLRRGTEDDEA